MRNWRVVALGFACGLGVFSAPAVQAQPITPTQKVAGVPPRYGRAITFLRLLAQSQGRSEGQVFGQTKHRFPDVARLVSFVSARGVTIVDVNENGSRPLVLSKSHLRRDLRRTGSLAFDSFAYVGYLFAQPYVQDSQLSCTPTRDGAVILMSYTHRFTWVFERGQLQLRKLEYLRLEGD